MRSKDSACACHQWQCAPLNSKILIEPYGGLCGRCLTPRMPVPPLQGMLVQHMLEEQEAHYRATEARAAQVCFLAVLAFRR